MMPKTIDITYVTQEDWDRAQIALRAAFEYVQARTPPLSTSGTDIDLQRLIAGAIVTNGPVDV